MKQIRETSDCAAYVVINKRGEHVATVHARYESGGAVQVDVWDRYELTHQKNAGGYGYDKFTAALAGAVIDGHKLADHCRQGDAAHEKKKAALLRAYRRAAAQGLTREQNAVWEQKARRIGCSFANWCRDNAAPVEADGKGGTQHGYMWCSLHTVAGLDRLEMLGYRVIRAL